MEENTRTILDYGVLQQEIAKAWKVLPAKLGEDFFINTDTDNQLDYAVKLFSDQFQETVKSN